MEERDLDELVLSQDDWANNMILLISCIQEKWIQSGTAAEKDY